MIKIISDYSELDAELDRLERLTTVRDDSKLDAVLGHAFSQSQAAVHVRTGSLKGSGKKNSDSKPRKWTGQITYGGPSTGPKNPVGYAIYEMRRGDDHDFFTNLHLLDALWIGAMKETLRG